MVGLYVGARVDGALVGWPVGYAEGIDVGRQDGIPVGTEEVGALLGTDEGSPDGLLEGIEGSEVGSEVGKLLVGYIVGTPEGTAVDGDADGDPEGTVPAGEEVGEGVIKGKSILVYSLNALAPLPYTRTQLLSRGEQYMGKVRASEVLPRSSKVLTMIAIPTPASGTTKFSVVTENVEFSGTAMALIADPTSVLVKLNP